MAIFGVLGQSKRLSSKTTKQLNLSIMVIFIPFVLGGCNGEDSPNSNEVPALEQVMVEALDNFEEIVNNVEATPRFTLMPDYTENGVCYGIKMILVNSLNETITPTSPVNVSVSSSGDGIFYKSNSSHNCVVTTTKYEFPIGSSEIQIGFFTSQDDSNEILTAETENGVFEVEWILNQPIDYYPVLTGPTTTVDNTSFGYDIELQDSKGNPLVAARPVSVDLDATGVSHFFYANSDCSYQLPDKRIILEPGQSRAHFCVTQESVPDHELWAEVGDHRFTLNIDTRHDFADNFSLDQSETGMQHPDYERVGFRPLTHPIATSWSHLKAFPFQGDWIIAGRVMVDEASTFSVARIKNDGQFEESFGALRGVYDHNDHSGAVDHRVTAVSSDQQSIFLAGTYKVRGVLTPLVIKITSNGIRAKDFGANGILILTDFPDSVPNAIHVQKDNKILLDITRGDLNSRSAQVIRLLPDGQKDVNFGNFGHARPMTRTGTKDTVKEILETNEQIIVIAHDDNPYFGGVSQTKFIFFDKDGKIDDRYVTGGVYAETGEFSGASIHYNEIFFAIKKKDPETTDYSTILKRCRPLVADLNCRTFLDTRTNVTYKNLYVREEGTVVASAALESPAPNRFYLDYQYESFSLNRWPKGHGWGNLIPGSGAETNFVIETLDGRSFFGVSVLNSSTIYLGYAWPPPKWTLFAR